MIEVIQYEKPIFKPEARARSPGAINVEGSRRTDEEQQMIREMALRRARSTLRRTILSNVWRWYDKEGEVIRPKFVTFTFKENMTDLDEANHEYMKFIKRLNRHYGGRKGKAELKYMVVPEFQKRGAVHYHTIFFNLPYIPAKKLKEIWVHGNIKINAIDEVDNVGAYVTKYMSKDNNDDRLLRKKCFWGSRGLIKPNEKRFEGEEGKREVDSLAATLSPFQTFQKTFDHPEIGVIGYVQYNTRRKVAPEIGEAQEKGPLGGPRKGGAQGEEAPSLPDLEMVI